MGNSVTDNPRLSADHWQTFGRNLGAKLGVDGLVLRRTGVERQQNQRDFGRGGGDRTHDLRLKSIEVKNLELAGGARLTARKYVKSSPKIAGFRAPNGR